MHSRKDTHDPDLPGATNQPVDPQTLSIVIHNPVSNTSPNHTETTPAPPCLQSTAIIMASTLTLLGASSDAFQKLFGSDQALGVTDVTAAIREASSAAAIVRISYLLLASAAAFIQSICLEKSFSLNFVNSLLRLTPPVDTGTEEAALLEKHPLLELQVVEKGLLCLTTLFGAIVRGLSSLMGFYTIDNSLSLAIKIPSWSASTVDTLQALATEGVYFKKMYLLTRLRLQQKWHPSQYDPDFIARIRHVIDDEAYHCQQKAGVAAYALTMILGSMAVVSDVGLAKLVIESFTDIYDIDDDAIYVNLPKWFSLISFFLLVTAIDSKSLADNVGRYLEQRSQPPETEAPPPTTQPTTHSAFIGLAVLVSLLGASITAVGAFEGNQYLLNGDANALLTCFSVVVAAIKFFQSLAVEGKFTVTAAKQSQWQIPSCSIFKRVRPAAQADPAAPYHRLSGGNEQTDHLPEARQVGVIR